MRKLFLTGFLAAVGYAGLTAYETAADAFSAAAIAARDRMALADSLR
jgi:hypothetical protein